MVINLCGKAAYATKLLLHYHNHSPNKRFEARLTLLRVLQVQVQISGLRSIRPLPQDSIILALRKVLDVEQVTFPSPMHRNNKFTLGNRLNGNKSNNNHQYSPNPNLHLHQTSSTSL
jgi:hypothetical protein